MRKGVLTIVLIMVLAVGCSGPSNSGYDVAGWHRASEPTGGGRCRRTIPRPRSQPANPRPSRPTRRAPRPSRRQAVDHARHRAGRRGRRRRRRRAVHLGLVARRRSPSRYDGHARLEPNSNPPASSNSTSRPAPTTARQCPGLDLEAGRDRHLLRRSPTGQERRRGRHGHHQCQGDLRHRAGLRGPRESCQGTGQRRSPEPGRTSDHHERDAYHRDTYHRDIDRRDAGRRSASRERDAVERLTDGRRAVAG